MNKAAFFDRDGTINVDVHHLYEPDKLVFCNGVPALIRACNEKGYMVIVVTNQAGIAKGLYTERDMHQLHAVMNRRLKAEFGAHIDAFYFCPHHPDYTGACNCRKPATGMLEQAVSAHNIDVEKSILIGDMPHDIQCGEAMGIKSYLVEQALEANKRGLLL